MQRLKNGYKRLAYVAGAVALAPVCLSAPAMATVAANGSPLPDLSTVDGQVTDITTLMSNTIKLGGGILLACIVLSLTVWAARHLGQSSKAKVH
jgi:protein-S-isoprenylcysteine O-methyltransferase Ste14